LTDEILKVREIEMYIASWRLVVGTHGIFDVVVNGERVFSKQAAKRHAEPGEIRAAILRKLDEVKPDRPPPIPMAD
jgi:hypothetical protein